MGGGAKEVCEVWSEGGRGKKKREGKVNMEGNKKIRGEK